MKMASLSSVWLAGEYTFPATYSICIPGCATTFAKACPVPGPGKVKLTLIKMAIELYGETRAGREVFPEIRSMDVLIRPRSYLGISGQFLRAFDNTSRNNGEVQPSISNREHIHGSGSLTIYARIPIEIRTLIESLFRQIGYWGQGNSLTYCLSTRCLEPKLGECITRLDTIKPRGLTDYQICYITDLDSKATWDDVVAGKGKSLSLYVLPLKVVEQKKSGKLSKYEPLPR